MGLKLTTLKNLNQTTVTIDREELDQLMRDYEEAVAERDRMRRQNTMLLTVAKAFVGFYAAEED